MGGFPWAVPERQPRHKGSVLSLERHTQHVTCPRTKIWSEQVSNEQRQRTLLLQEFQDPKEEKQGIHFLDSGPVASGSVYIII